MTLEELKQKALKDYGNMILEIIKTDPKFKEQFIEELNKKNYDMEDRDIEVDIGLSPIEVDDHKMSYTIATGKRRNDFSSTPVGSICMSRRLLRSLYIQLKELDEKGELKP